MSLEGSGIPCPTNGSEVTNVLTIVTMDAASPVRRPLVDAGLSASLSYAGAADGLSGWVSVMIGVADSAGSAVSAPGPPLFINTLGAFSTMLPPASNTCTPADLVVTLPPESFTISDVTLLYIAAPVVLYNEPAELKCISPSTVVVNKFSLDKICVSAFDSILT